MKTFKIFQFAFLFLLLTDITSFDPRLRKWRFGVEAGCPVKKDVCPKKEKESLCLAQKEPPKGDKCPEPAKELPKKNQVSKCPATKQAPKCSTDKGAITHASLLPVVEAECPKTVKQISPNKICHVKTCNGGKDCKCK